MQNSKEKLAAQQLVLFHLGFYTGTIDGIWSDASIKAKAAFEADEKFLPAFPNGGLPFGERDKLPKRMVYGKRGLIEHLDLTPERAKEILDATEKRIAARKQSTEAKVEQPLNPETVATAQAAEIAVAETKVEETPDVIPTTKPNQNNQNHHKHQKNR